MIIDPRFKRRIDHFRRPESSDISQRYMGTGGNTYMKDLLALNEARGVVVGTVEGDLEAVLEGRPYTVDSVAVIDKIADADPSLLVVLPPEYDFGEKRSRDLIVHSKDSFLSLDSVHVARRLAGNPELKRGRLGKKRKMELECSPEKVFGEVFGYLQDNHHLVDEHNLVGATWFGSDGHRKIITPVENVQGFGMVAYQDFAWWKHHGKELAKEVDTGNYFDGSGDIPPDVLEHKREKLEKYRYYISSRKIGNKIKCLDSGKWDLIEVTRRPEQLSRTAFVKVFSRGFRLRRQGVQLRGLPLVDEEHYAHAYAAVWDIAGDCHCPEKQHAQDYLRGRKLFGGHTEDFYCDHEVAAAIRAQTREKNGEWNIPMLPFPLPTAATMSLVHRLRYGTLVLANNDHRKGTRVRVQRTAMNKLLMAYAAKHGYEHCFSTDVQAMVRKNPANDPHLSAIRFDNPYKRSV